MKNVFRVLIVAAFFAVFALPALAQDAAAGGASAQDVQAKADQYQQFLKLKSGTPAEQKQAYELAKDYLNKYGNATEESDKKIVDYIRGWVNKYEVAVRNFNCTDAFSKKDYARAFEACRVVLNAEPDNTDVTLLLARAGYANVTLQTPNKALNPEAIRMARRAAELIESGKAPAKWDPFPSRDEALGFLYYEQGVLARETSPAEAAAAFIKAAQSNSSFKRESSTYTYLANIYETTELKKLVDEYNANFSGKEITDEQRPRYQELLAQIGRVQDRIIDAYARAAAILNADPKADAARKTAVMKTLTAYYKQRHQDKEDGLQQLIAGVMNTPLMLPGQEPAPTTPAASSSSAVSGTDGAVKPAVTGAPATTAKPAPAATTGAKPATNGTGAKPSATQPKPQSKTTTKAAVKTTSGR